MKIRILAPSLCRLLALLAIVSTAAPLAQATVVQPPEFETLVQNSDCIVRAVTTSVASEKRAGPHGARIVTYVELRVVETATGAPGDRIVLELLGGRIGREVLTVEGMPQFKVGDEDILFVSGNGTSVCPLYGMMHGRFPVQTDASGRKYVARSNGEPLRRTADIATPMNTVASTTRTAAVAAAIGPSEFLQQIRAAKAAVQNRAK